MLSDQQPLWLPKGSVRALVSLLVVITFLLSEIFLPESETGLREVFMVVIGFYFGSRTSK